MTTSQPEASLSDLVDLGGKRALVTGGGKGIGAAIVQRLVEAGASVTVADLDAGAVGEVERIGADFVVCDVADADQLHHAVELAAGESGLDIVVNNAGIFPTTGPLTEVTDEFVRRMLDVNVRAQFSATREAAARMPNGGSIVNLAVRSRRSGGGANISAYAASKAGVIALTRAAAIELGRRGIRVNAIAPGVIDTPGVQEQMAPLRAGGIDIDPRIAANPVGLRGMPDHIARAAIFLVSDLAAFVSGHVLVVDGGSTA